MTVTVDPVMLVLIGLVLIVLGLVCVVANRALQAWYRIQDGEPRPGIRWIDCPLCDDPAVLACPVHDVDRLPPSARIMLPREDDGR